MYILYLYNELKNQLADSIPLSYHFIYRLFRYVTIDSIEIMTLLIPLLISKQRFLRVSLIYRLDLLSNHVSSTRYCIFHVPVRDRLIYVLF